MERDSISNKPSDDWVPDVLARIVETETGLLSEVVSCEGTGRTGEARPRRGTI